MKHILAFSLLFLSLQTAVAETTPSKKNLSYWPKHFMHRLHQIWCEGNNELYMTGYAWHNRYTYPPERIGTYNEQAWGGGLGKGFYDEDGDWQGLAAFAFLDSHKNIEPAGGYVFIKMLHVNENARIGAGYSFVVTQRRDIFNGIPFPGALPWMLVSYRRLAIGVTYIPGPINRTAPVGNIVFVLGKLTF